MRRYPGGGAFALFFHPHTREFATQNKKSANARGLARGGGGWAQLELTDALGSTYTTDALLDEQKILIQVPPDGRSVSYIN